jgi:hypothetical protein
VPCCQDVDQRPKSNPRIVWRQVFRPGAAIEEQQGGFEQGRIVSNRLAQRRDLIAFFAKDRVSVIEAMYATASVEILQREGGSVHASAGLDSWRFRSDRS